jgi:hypothetical protein
MEMERRGASRRPASMVADEFDLYSLPLITSRGWGRGKWFAGGPQSRSE